MKEITNLYLKLFILHLLSNSVFRLYGETPGNGATTYTGEKEVVGGIVLMLKGANSAEVVKKVKDLLSLTAYFIIHFLNLTTY